MKRLLSLSLLLCSLPALGALATLDESMTLALPSACLSTRNIGEPINVLYNSEGFTVAHNSQFTKVKSYDVDHGLRKMDVNQAAKVLAATQLQVSRLSSGEFTIAQHGELKGGGPGGAMAFFWIGKGVVYIAGHGPIIAAGIGSGPWGFLATVGALEATYGAQIEAASNVVGHNAAVFGLFVTGPV